MEPPRLVVEGLTCGHSAAAPTLRDVDLRLEAGRTTVLVGESGCGKTTLLRTLLGLQPPLAGAATVLGAPLPRRPPPGTVGYIPQGLGLVRHVSVLQNVLLGTLPRHRGLRGAVGAWRSVDVAGAKDALRAVALEHKADQKPVHLSGGERRRVAVARTLAQRPRLLLADEFLGELDERTRGVVLGAVEHLQRETGMSVLMVEHDLDTACAVADEILALSRGRVVARMGPDGADAGMLREVMLAGA